MSRRDHDLVAVVDVVVVDTAAVGPEGVALAEACIDLAGGSAGRKVQKGHLHRCAMFVRLNGLVVGAGLGIMMGERRSRIVVVAVG